MSAAIAAMSDATSDATTNGITTMTDQSSNKANKPPQPPKFRNLDRKVDTTQKRRAMQAAHSVCESIFDRAESKKSCMYNVIHSLSLRLDSGLPS
jgi:hypothetical protein